MVRFFSPDYSQRLSNIFREGRGNVHTRWEQLAAASRGLGLHPMSQPLEVPQMRDRLSALLPSSSKMKVVQQTFRLGYAPPEEEHSGRRPLEEVLIEK